MASPSQASMLEEYLNMLQEAQKRDHRKLGKELQLFSFHQEGAGFPFWHPAGMVLIILFAITAAERHIRAAYQEVKTPIILNEELWKRSGHYDNIVMPCISPR